MLHRLAAKGRIARTVGNEESVPFQGVEIIVPRHSNQLYTPRNQASEYLVLYSAIHKHHSLVSFAILPYFLAADYCHLIVYVGVVVREVLGHALRNYLSEHGTLFPEHFGELAGVDAEDAGDFLLLEPFVKTLDCIPVAVLLAVVRDNEPSDVNLFGLESRAESILVKFFGRNAVIPYERVTYAEYLPRIRRVGEALGIAYHSCGEYYFSRCSRVIAETPSFQPASVLEDKRCFFACF